MQNWTIAKFGGTSMESYESMQRCAAIVDTKLANIVVVSATAGTTNQLVSLTKNVLTQNWDKIEDELNQIKTRHESLIEKIELSENAKAYFYKLFDQTRALLKGCSLLKECSPRAYDGILSFGELSSSLIFAQSMREKIDKEIVWFDSRLIIKTDNQYNKAAVNLDLIAKNVQQTFNDKNKIYIGQGFIGSGPDGSTTTLGRGGSDFSAALIAEALNASLLQIWTDVPGMASTDPRICSDAKSIEKISFIEAAEMATFGAKILHPATLAPAIRKGITVFVGSTFEPNAKGTMILENVDNGPNVRAITLRKEQAILTLSNPKMLNASGFLKKIFEIFDFHQISVDAVTTSEISVAITINREDLNLANTSQSLLTDLQNLGKVQIDKDVSLVAIIGNKIPQTPRLGERIFKSLEGINVRMITQGASPHNFCFMVQDNDANLAIQRLHNHFIIEESKNTKDQA